MKKILLGCAAAVLSAGLAHAADMAPVYKAAPATMFNWSGFYAGVHGGYAWGENNVLDSALGVAPGTRYNFEPAGGFGGLQIGYNSQFAPHWLIGGEIDSSWGDVSDAFTPTTVATTGHERLNYFGSARTRFGYVQDRSLLYITGGVAWAHENFTNSPLTASIVSHFLVGGVIGVGWEYAFDPHWSFKAEYLYTSFNNNVDRSGGGANRSFDADLNTVRVGLNYRFADTGSAATYMPVKATTVRSGWNGGYLGVHGGYGWSDYHSIQQGGTVVDINPSGGFGGFQGGANWQFAPNWVFGLETDASYGSLKDDAVIGGNNVSAKLDGFGTARARLGYAVENWMLYGTAGGAYGREKSVIVNTIASKEDHFGWAAGAGIEWKIASDWSAKIEYIHMDLGENKFDDPATGLTRRTDFSVDTVKVGLNYYGPVIERLFAGR